jgi:hypothetical protein
MIQLLLAGTRAGGAPGTHGADGPTKRLTITPGTPPAVRNLWSAVDHSRLRTRDSELETQNSKLKTQNSKLKTQDSRLKTQDSKLKTQNSKLHTL